MTLNLEEFKNQYAPSLLEDFILYWCEPDQKGKERWQKEKTWNTSMRLKRWKRQQDKWNHKDSQKFVKEIEPVRQEWTPPA